MTPSEQDGFVYEGNPEDGIDWGSCERCGVDLNGPSPEELCDQCLWRLEQYPCEH